MKGEIRTKHAVDYKTVDGVWKKINISDVIKHKKKRKHEPVEKQTGLKRIKKHGSIIEIDQDETKDTKVKEIEKELEQMKKQWSQLS